MCQCIVCRVVWFVQLKLGLAKPVENKFTFRGQDVSYGIASKCLHNGFFGKAPDAT